jgi:hypothetical protein
VLRIVCRDVAPTGAHVLRPECILIIDIFWVFMVVCCCRTPDIVVLQYIDALWFDASLNCLRANGKTPLFPVISSFLALLPVQNMLLYYTISEWVLLRRCFLLLRLENDILSTILFLPLHATAFNVCAANHQCRQMH